MKTKKKEQKNENRKPANYNQNNVKYEEQKIEYTLFSVLTPEQKKKLGINK